MQEVPLSMPAKHCCSTWSVAESLPCSPSSRQCTSWLWRYVTACWLNFNNFLYINQADVITALQQMNDVQHSGHISSNNLQCLLGDSVPRACLVFMTCLGTLVCRMYVCVCEFMILGHSMYVTLAMLAGCVCHDKSFGASAGSSVPY